MSINYVLELIIFVVYDNYEYRTTRLTGSPTVERTPPVFGFEQRNM